jgi:hypothetical protein
MPAPLVGIAVAAAARMAAKKLAQQGAKKVAKTATSRARSNSAAAAKAVAPKKRSVKKLSPVKVLEPIKRPGPVKINTNPKPVVVKPVRTISPAAQQSIDAARKALGSSKPDPKALARRITQDKAREMARIRKQGRNTR